MNHQNSTHDNEKLHPRERLLRAAAHLFAQKGYTATTVREIITAAQVTKPVLYYYFTSKEGIYTALIADAHGIFNRILEEVETAPGASWDRLVYLCERLYSLYKHNLDLISVIQAQFFGPQQEAPIAECLIFHQQLKAAIQSYLTEEIQNHEFCCHSIEAATLVVMSAVHGIMGMEWFKVEEAKDVDRLHEMLNVVYRGLKP